MRCVHCDSDASAYAGVLLGSFVTGDVPFARCEECGSLWCKNCWRPGEGQPTCPTCGGKMKADIS